MFGKINNEQNVINADNYGKLMNNPKFIGTPGIITEEALFNLIKNYYNDKNKEKLLECCYVYQKYEYKKYLDIITQYISKYE